MIKVKDIIEKLESFAPAILAEDFDNVGLIMGRGNKEAKKVLLCLDADEKTASEAIEKNADLIISHHPLIFNPIKRINEDDSMGRCLISLAKSDISVYCAHTNMDKAKGGLNDLMAEKLSLSVIDSLENKEGELSCGRIGKWDKDLITLVKKVKEVYNLPFVRYSGENREIKKVAICTGSGRSLLKDVLEKECDCYITGDLHYSDIRELNENNIAHIDIGHFESEIGITEIFKKILEKDFSAVEFLISEEENVVKVLI